MYIKFISVLIVVSMCLSACGGSDDVNTQATQQASERIASCYDGMTTFCASITTKDNQPIYTDEQCDDLLKQMAEQRACEILDQTP